MPTVVGTQGFRNDVVPGGWNSTPRSRWYLPGPNRTESLQAAPWQKNPLVGFRQFRMFEVGWEKEIYKWPELFFFNINVCFLRFFLGVKFSPSEWKIRDPGLTWHEISMWGEVSLLEGGAQLATSRWMDSPKVLFFLKTHIELEFMYRDSY